jgi:hypothetical protein
MDFTIRRLPMTDDSSPNVPSPPSTISRLVMAAQFAKEYFVILSATAVVVGVTLAMAFLYGYLRIFDWRLLWVIQYQDVLTFGLVALGLVVGLGTVLPTIVDQVLQTGIAKGTPNWTFISVAIAFLALFVAFNIYAEHRRADPHYFHILLGWGILLTVAFGALMIARMVHLGLIPTAWSFAWGATTIVLVMGSFGTWLGMSVLESNEYSDVYLKGQTLTKAKLVMMMSHHTILYWEKTVYVVPTTEVIKIVNLQPQ